MSRKSAVRAENGFTWFILNEDRNDIIKVLKSLEDSGILIDRVTETVKYEIIKKTRRQMSWKFVSTIILFISATSILFSSKRYH